MPLGNAILGFLDVGNSFLQGYMQGKALKLERQMAQHKADLADRDFEEVKLARIATDRFRAETAQREAESRNRLRAAQTLRTMAQAESEPAARHLLLMKADEIEFGDIPLKQAQTAYTGAKTQEVAPNARAYRGRLAIENTGTLAGLPANRYEELRKSDALRIATGLPIPGAPRTAAGATDRGASAGKVRWVEEHLYEEMDKFDSKKLKLYTPEQRSELEDSVREDLSSRYDRTYGPKSPPATAPPDTTAIRP